MWGENKPSTRVSQLPALPPIVSSPRQRTSDPSRAHQGEPEYSNAVSTWNRDQPLDVSSSRFLRLESRVGLLEQANRALLEEIVQVQADTKARQIHEREAVRNNWQELERLREMIEEKVAILEGLERRVFENERSIDRGQGTVDLLLQSTQEVERGVRESQTELLLRLKKDQAMVHLEQVKDDLHHLEQKCLRFQEGVGHDCSGLGEEVRRLRSGIDVQSAGMESAVSGIRQHLKRLEVEHDSMEGGLSRVEIAIGRLESTDMQLRKQLDSKISEVGGGLVEVRGALTHQENERKRQELWLKESFSQLQEDISWVSQRTSDSLHTIAMEMEKNEKNAATEHAQLVAKVTTALEESSKEGQENSQKMKELLKMQIGGLEKALQTERAVRCSHEAEANSAVAARCKELQTKVEEQLDAIRSNMEQEQQSTQHGLAAVLGSVSVLEGEGRAAREDLSNVLNAEIRTRQEEVAGLQLQCGALQKECWRTLEVVREELESLEGRLATDRKEMGQRIMADVDTRVSALHQYIVTSNSERKQEDEDAAKEGVAEEKPIDSSEATDGRGDGSLAEWQGAMGSRVGALERQLNRLAVALQELQVKLVGQVQQETNERFHSILDLRNEIANIHAQMPVLFEDPRAYNQSVRIAHYDGRLAQENGPFSVYFEADGDQQAIARRGSLQRDGTNPLRGYTPIAPVLLQRRPKGSELDPRVGPHLFRNRPQTQDLGMESYLSEGSQEEQSDSEGERANERPEATDVLTPHNRDQVETTPEPSSPHSSTENHPRRGPLSRAKPSQKHSPHERHPLPVAQHYERAETQGTFTSAAPTPDSQQRLPTHDQAVEELGIQTDPSISIREAESTVSDHGAPPEDRSGDSRPAPPLELSVTNRDSPSIALTQLEAEPAGNSPSVVSPEIRRHPSGESGETDTQGARGSTGAQGGPARSSREDLVEVVGQANDSDDSSFRNQQDRGLPSPQELNADNTEEL